MGKEIIKVAGITHKNADGTSRQEILENMKPEECGIYLMNKPTEEHPEAIAVYNYVGRQIGFVPQEIAEIIRVDRIPIDEIRIESCEFYKFKPIIERLISPEEGFEKEEIYGCKFVMEHPRLNEYFDAEEDEDDGWDDSAILTSN